MSNIIVGANKASQQTIIENKMANRHGLIAGATGTGKTVTLQVLAEQFSKQGVPVFLADVKGDLSGLAKPGKAHEKIQERVDKIGLGEFTFSGSPCVFWDLYGENGHPIRTTVSGMGALLLARLLDLSDAQEDALHIIFKYSKDQKLPLLNLKDLKSLVTFFSENTDEIKKEYGSVAKNTLGTLQRKLSTLDASGEDQFFSEPALDINHIMQVDFSGNGVISILDAQKLMLDRRLYSCFLLWFLSELFENLDEVGDPEKPKLVFFFDEAHLIFNDAPKALLEKIEMVVRLIRSKGVGVYFVTQNPLDIPESVLGQLGNRVQHALRAFTAKDKKAVKMAAETFRENPGLDTVEVITNLGTGESLVSTLDLKGAPRPVEEILNSPPHSRMGPLTDEERKEIIDRSPLKSVYKNILDSESAYEMLKKREEKKEQAEDKEDRQILKSKPKRAKSRRQSPMEAFFKSFLRSIASQLGRTLMRSFFKQ